MTFTEPIRTVLARVTCRVLLAIAFCLNACSKGELGTDPSSAPRPRVVRIDRADAPIPGISSADLERFRAGDELFDATFREVDGLGPLFTRASCSHCHAEDSRGPGVVTRVGRLDPGLPDERLAALLPFGDTERPYAIGQVKPLLFPDDTSLKKSRRLPPAVFGRGYIEAVDDQAIIDCAALARPSHISGRIARLSYGAAEPRIGRFGLKARTPDLRLFAAEALRDDMGLTSRSYPSEPANESGVNDDAKPGLDVDDAQVEALADYVRLLALPERRVARDGEGALLFASLGCSDCHVPSLRTRADYPIAQLANIEAPIYSDLLLHDMGAELSDGVREGAAQSDEWRTAPLIGLRFQSAYLHDGRATSVEEAILLHGGPGSEAAPSRDAFVALHPEGRELLLGFVQGL